MKVTVKLSLAEAQLALIKQIRADAPQILASDEVTVTIEPSEFPVSIVSVVSALREGLRPHMMQQLGLSDVRKIAQSVCAAAGRPFV